ncbi:major facilitator superfamily domain-containing protein [Pisolithus croceorrhizus]|nr:major facilitator superfamily domain-containing protein [Pisolithus croceorrhizus]
MAPLTDTTRDVPGLLSTRRIITLLGSILVALSSGTYYIFSAYAPQLGARLHISYTQLNVVGVAGNVGVFASGPIWGRIVDSRGPRIPLIGAFVCFLFGYAGMKCMYDGGTGSETSISTTHFSLLIICGLLTGLGANAGIISAVNATAKSFPESTRATTTGLVLSGCGLSAFCLSTVARAFFPGDTPAFLLLLALSTSIPTFIAIFIVRVIPLPPTYSGPGGNQTGNYEPITSGEVVPFVADCFVSTGEGDARMPLLGARPEAGLSPVLEMECTSGYSRPDALLEIHGALLFRSPDFYLLFMIMLLLTGTGLMYINNVGAMALALVAKSNPNYDEVEASKQQAAQVSTLSIGNFAGRILIGLISDFTHSHFRLPRGYYLCIVSLLFIISQAFAIGISNASTLWMATAILGLAYGSLFGIHTVITIDWFGLAHLSENSGYVSLAPLVGGNILSIMFGRNLDAHTPRKETNALLGVAHVTSAVGTAVTEDMLSERQCLLGQECYVWSLKVTLVTCVLALALSIWAALRDKHRHNARKKNWE